MGKVLWHITMSLDGFVAGPRDDMTWLSGGDFGADSQVVDQVLGQIGAIVMGHRTYHGGAWQGPQFVLTRDTPEAAAPGFTFLGPTTAKRVLQASLLDEVLVHVAPLLLGDGIRLFDQPGGAMVKLQPIDGTPPVTNLRFRVAP